MTERSRPAAAAAEGCSNPLATVEDIRRRLVRPSSLPRDDVPSRNSTQFKANLHEEVIVTNKKLEDYLDPYLLSAISSKIGKQNRNSVHAKRNGNKQVKEFEWPVDELKVFMEDSTSSEKRVGWKIREAVDLNDDGDLMKDVEVEHDESCTPFWRFEKTALRMFKG